jgi:hypothetical protein
MLTKIWSNNPGRHGPNNTAVPEFHFTHWIGGAGYAQRYGTTVSFREVTLQHRGISAYSA